MKTYLGAAVVATVFVIGLPSPAAGFSLPLWTWVARHFGGANLTPFATRGVVKAIGLSSVVIARFKGLGEIALQLTSATAWEGRPVVGSVVSVRYREENGAYVATAITVLQDSERKTARRE